MVRPSPDSSIKSAIQQFHKCKFCQVWRKQWETTKISILIWASCYLLSSMSAVSYVGSQLSSMTTESWREYENERSTTNSSGGSMSPLQLPNPKGKGFGKKGKGKGEIDSHPERDPINRGQQLLLGPQFRPSRVVCACCGETGHHVQNCVKAIEQRNAKAMTDCVRGRHYPYLHGVWRCNWCGMHLHDIDVRRQCPRLYAREAARDKDKIERYGSPAYWQ